MKDNNLFLSFSNIPIDELLRNLKTSLDGLSSDEASKRQRIYGRNTLNTKKSSNTFLLLLSQFKSPIILILIFAAILSIFLRDSNDAIIILIIILISSLLGFWQERGADNAVEKLLSRVQINAAVLRNGKEIEIPSNEIVPGDIIMLNAGDLIPGDMVLIESKDFYVNESALTGESFPVNKLPGEVEKDSSISKRINTLFMGTSVTSGIAKAVVVNIGKNTVFGNISERLNLKPVENDFERGVKKFGYLLMEVTIGLVLVIFTINIFLKKPVVDSFLFSLAIAVGLTPQLLPAIISINLSHGAKKMAQNKVIVKKLSSIENFGSMNILCSDKTGTLTEGNVKVYDCYGIDGNSVEKVNLYAYVNSYFETGFTSPIDEAIKSYKNFNMENYNKMDEIPYDFIRKRLSILAREKSIEKNLMVTKGALKEILEISKFVEDDKGNISGIDNFKTVLDEKFKEYSNQGYRVLGVAYKYLDKDILKINKDMESGMTFLGFVLMFDPLKENIAQTIGRLQKIGISLKIITGDNLYVSEHIAEKLNIDSKKILTGKEINKISDGALIKIVNDINIFAEVEPNQKERIILAFKKAGNVVGYIGDGINDATALYNADVGISVDSAADVAKNASDIVLLEKDLGVLEKGVIEGRTTFANTMKYVFMATSANFGNMFSMAGASVFLKFLPLLPKQILLTNLFTDVSEMTIATDNVDSDFVLAPRRWDIKFILKFMITFGLLSSIFDFITFGVLIYFLRANEYMFRTGWFVESILSASIVVLIIRSKYPFYKSKPGKYLIIAIVLTALVTIAIPFTSLGAIFGFVKIPINFLLILLLILIVYMVLAEVTKKIFYNHVKY
ncbi:MAG: magnesium-translocating P-type ATPase [Candidatus Humimicrobiaceae bacterium]